MKPECHVPSPICGKTAHANGTAHMDRSGYIAASKLEAGPKGKDAFATPYAELYPGESYPGRVKKLEHMTTQEIFKKAIEKAVKKRIH